MNQKNTNHLKNLETLLEEEGVRDSLFLCIKDLVENGLVESRFKESDFKPNRQDITQHLLSWFYYIRIPKNACMKWMMDFCTDALAPMSSSSPSQIRHSTKSNSKYIYGSEISLDCGCEENVFKANCDKSCPAYGEMKRRYKERLHRNAVRASGVVERPAPPTIEPFVPLKEKYKDQFEKALELIKKCIEEKKTAKEIVSILIREKYVTRTGKRWNVGILTRELKKLYDDDPEFKKKAKNKEDSDRLSVKDLYADQLNKAVELAIEKRNEGLGLKDIAKFLNEQGYKSRSGKKWKSATVSVELRRLREEQ